MSNLSYAHFTGEVGAEITQLGEALLEERAGRLRGLEGSAKAKTGITILSPIKANYPELEEGFKMRTERGTNVAVFSGSKDPSRFQGRPVAVTACLDGPLKRSKEVRDWYDEMLAGAIAQLWDRFESEREKDHLTRIRFANAEASLRSTRRPQPFPLDYTLTNYVPHFEGGSGFLYKPGFVVAVQFPALAVSVCSQNGTGIEGCVAVRGFNIPVPMEQELANILGITRALRDRVAAHQKAEIGQPPFDPIRKKLHLSRGRSRRGSRGQNQ